MHPRIRNLSFETHNNLVSLNPPQLAHISSIPQFGETLPKKDSFLGTIKKRLIGIANNNQFLNSLQFIEKKLANDDFGFHPVSSEFTEKKSFYSESEKQKYNQKFLISENFDLLDFLVNENRQTKYPPFVKNIFEEIQKDKYVYGGTRRQKAIKKYKQKKNQRKNSNFIRYKVRKNLAEKRKRFKGKFVKNEKIDMKKAMQDFLKEKVTLKKGDYIYEELKNLKIN